MPPLSALRTFEAAARLGSFTRAARELHVTPAAVSHQIRGLESYLGVVLFRRTTRRLVLTEPAAAALVSLREAFDRIAQGVDELRSSGRRESLSIGVTPAFAARWLVQRLPRFQKRHPRVEIHVRASPSPVDFDQDDIDVAIRIGRGNVEGCTVVPLFGEWIGPVASPGFLRRNPLRRTGDVARAPLIHDDSMRRSGRRQGWPEWFKASGVVPTDRSQGTHFDDAHLALVAAAAGGGIALGRLVYAAEDIAARRLRIAAAPLIRMDIAYHLLIPDARMHGPAVAAFRSWLESEAESFRGQFEDLLRGRRISEV
jgi:LysR family glycine cleavage system transcriptional activator